MLDGAILSGDGQIISAPRVGADLRAARERLGHALPDLARILRIRLPYLQALETGCIGDLPGTAYAVGFLRTYAIFLGLDPEEIIRRFKIESDNLNQKPQLEFLAPIPDRGVPAGAVVLLGVLLALGAYIGWYRLSGEGHQPSELVALMPERLASLVTRPAPSPAARVAAPEIVVPPAAAEALRTEMSAPDTPAARSTEEVAALPSPPPATSAQAATTQAAPTPVAPTLVVPMFVAATPVAAAQAAPAPVAIAPPPAAPPSPAADSRIVIRATADAWIQVRDHGGTVLFAGILKPGETYAVPNRPDLTFTTGNALGTELLVDGVVSPGLGTTRNVRRDLALDAEMIKTGRLALQAHNTQQPAPQQIVTRPQ